jgi:hypothetical protein
MKTYSPHARDVGHEHRDLGVELDVSRGKAGIDQRVLEGEAAAQQKCDQIVTPDVSDVAPPLGQLAVPVDAISLARPCGGRRRGPSEPAPDRPAG